MKKSLLRALILLALCVFFVPQQTQAVTLKSRKSKVYIRKNQIKSFRVKGISKKIKWHSKNKHVARITKRGNIQALHAGKATIYGKAKGRTYKCKVVVVNISKTKAFMKKGSKKKLKVFHGGDKVTWRSTNASVATVKNGKVRAVGSGVCTIVARARGYKFKCKVYVPAVVFPTGKLTMANKLYKPPVPEEEPEETTEETIEEVANTVFANAAATGGKKVGKIKTKYFRKHPRFSSSKPSVAKVLSDGTVIALKAGSTTITVSANGLKYSQRISISSQPVDIFLKHLNRYNRYVKAHGRYFKRYDTPEDTFADAKEKVSQKKTAKINCRAPETWAFYDMGFIPSKIYAKNGSFRGTFKGTMKLYLTRLKSDPAIGLTYREAINNGYLKPGDICCFKNRTHTFTYSGVGYCFFDAGSLAQMSGYTNVGCRPDYSKITYYSDRKISEILRWNSYIGK